MKSSAFKFFILSDCSLVPRSLNIWVSRKRFSFFIALLKHAGLDHTRHGQLLLMIGNDLTRYEELKNHFERIAKASQPSSLPGPSGNYGELSEWADDWPEHAHWLFDDASWTWRCSDDGIDWCEADDADVGGALGR